MRNLLASLWGAIYTFLKTDKVKELLKIEFKKLLLKLLKKQAMRGIRGWLLSFVAEEMAEDAIKYIINPVLRKGNYVLEIKNGNHIVKKMEDATNYDDWRRNAHKL